MTFNLNKEGDFVDALSIERVWEDADFFEIEVTAKSDQICARCKGYTTVESIEELASNLSVFPQSLGDKYVWEAGVKGNAPDLFPYVSLGFRCKDKLGHIIIEVLMEMVDNDLCIKNNCSFSIETEVGLLNSFGRSLALLNERGIGKKITLLSKLLTT